MNFAAKHPIRLYALWLCLLACVSPALAQAQIELTLGCATTRASTDIAAPYELVYETVTDTSHYPDWNPYIVSVDPPVWV